MANKESEYAIRTPGPWDVKGPSQDGHCRRIFAGDEYVAIVGGSDQPMRTIRANAALIAESPEMFQVVDRLAEPGFLGESELILLIQECRRIVSNVRSSYDSVCTEKEEK